MYTPFLSFSPVSFTRFPSKSYSEWRNIWKKMRGGKKEVFGGMGGMKRFYDFLIILCFIVTSASLHFGNAQELHKTLSEHITHFKDQSVDSITRIHSTKEKEPQTKRIMPLLEQNFKLQVAKGKKTEEKAYSWWSTTNETP